MLLDLNRLDEATAELREAIRLDSNNALAHNNLANSLALQGKLQDAITEYREAIRIVPRCYSAHHNLCISLAELSKDLSAALRSFEQSVKEAGNDDEACEGGFYMAMALAEIGDPSTAQDWYDQSASRMDRAGLKHTQLKRLRQARGKV